MGRAAVVIAREQIERIAIVFGEGKTMAQVKGDADYIFNGGFYDMSANRAVGHLKADGTVYSAEPWNCWGYVWDRGGEIRMAVVPDTPARNHLSGIALLTPWDGLDAKLTYPAEMGGARPRTAMAMTGDKLILYCTDKGTTPEQLRQELCEMGAETALMLDSGGSSQCDFGGGNKITSTRRVHNYLAVWIKKSKEDKPMGKKVVLDPGHGVETAGKRRPDGTYMEHEFNLDMAHRLKAQLERHGVSVILTRSTEHDVSLAARVNTANRAKPDLFVSLHSNAGGDGGSWTAPAGYCVYTSSAGETAGRNRAARAILARVKEAGIPLFGSGLYHDSLYVLRNTTAPAVLIEHGFHTNKEEVGLLKSESYRDKLAQSECRGILDYLGIPWEEEGPAPAADPVCPHCGGTLKIMKG